MTTSAVPEGERGRALASVPYEATSLYAGQRDTALTAAVQKVLSAPVVPAPSQLDDAIETAACWLFDARAILIGSGAGMSVDCGLGTYRGQHAGVWPPLTKLGLDYREIA